MKNKIVLLLLISCLALLLQGCTSFNFGYTDNHSLDVYNTKPISRKYDVTFSIYYFTARNDIIGQGDKEYYQKRIRENLLNTGLYSKVTYVPVDKPSSYHYHFNVIYNAPNVDTSFGIAFMSVYTLFTVPTWETTTIDISGMVFLNGKMVHSIATPEIIRCYYWLPLLPVGLIWNDWLAFSHVEGKMIRYVLNDLNNYHYGHYVNSSEKSNM